MSLIFEVPRWHHALFQSIVIASGILFGYLAGYTVHALYFSAHHHVPGPRICKITHLWIAYWDLRLLRNEKIYEWHQRYGDIVLVAPGQVSFSSIESTKKIYQSRGQHPKSAYFDNMKMYGERPVFCTLGWAEHRDIRKRTFSFYQPTSIHQPGTMQPLRSRTKLFLHLLDNEISKQDTVEVLSRCNRFSFDNITSLMYGERHAGRTMNDNESRERSILDGWKMCEVYNNLLYNLPSAHWAFRRVVSWYNKDPEFLLAEDSLSNWNWSKVAVSMRRDSAQNADESMVRHLQSQMQEHEPVSWMAAEVLDNLHAAQTTVALALTFVLWDLACNAVWQEKVRQELQTLSIQPDGLPYFAEINASGMLDACVRESYRIHPLSSGRAERVVPLTQEYDGVSLVEGTIVSSSTLALHRSAAVFPEPFTFQPDRWLQADAEMLRKMESSYMPFGQGARICLGKAFANAEIKLLIASILLKYNISTDPRSSTNQESMRQMGTQNALPKGLQCELSFRPLT